MSPAIKRRALCQWLCCAPALLCAPREMQAQDVPRDWGDLWQPSLPERERHPSLFYDGTARDRIVSRLSREPWKTWWAGLQAASPR
ncbi:MAG TPA: hypothetical protein VN622_14295, partial [Clostridia bacterium]|nr:hypothetical protein [Clostridia bacterium]